MSRSRPIEEMEAQLEEGVRGLTHLTGRLSTILIHVETTVANSRPLADTLSALNAEIGALRGATQKCVALYADLRRYEHELAGRERDLTQQTQNYSGVQQYLGSLDALDKRLSGIEAVNTRLDHQARLIEAVRDIGVTNHGVGLEGIRGIDKKLDDQARLVEAVRDIGVTNHQVGLEGIRGLDKKFDQGIAGVSQKLDDHAHLVEAVRDIGVTNHQVELESIRDLDKKFDQGIAGASQKLDQGIDVVDRKLDDQARLIEAVRDLGVGNHQVELEGIRDLDKKLGQGIANADQKLYQGIASVDRRLDDQARLIEAARDLSIGNHRTELQGIQDFDKKLDRSIAVVGPRLDDQYRQIEVVKNLGINNFRAGLEGIRDLDEKLDQGLRVLDDKLNSHETRLAAFGDDQKLQQSVLEKLANMGDHFASPSRDEAAQARPSSHGQKAKRKRADVSISESEPSGAEMEAGPTRWQSLLGTLRTAVTVSIEGEDGPLQGLQTTRRLLLQSLSSRGKSPEAFLDHLRRDENLDDWVCVATLCDGKGVLIADHDDYCSDCSQLGATGCLQVKKEASGKAVLRLARWRD